MVRDGKTAEACKKCGKCEQACPQHLNIREDLQKVLADIRAAQEKDA